MAQGDDDGDDLTVNLSWPGGPPVAGRRPAAEAALRQPSSATPPAPPPATPTGRGGDDWAAPPAAGRTGPPSMAAPAPTAPPLQPPAARASGATDSRRAQDGRSSSRPPAPAGRRPATSASGRSSGTTADETLLGILDHLTTLSKLVTGTSRATSAELAGLGGQIDKAVADLEALQLRVVRSLDQFDELPLRVRKELANRPQLTDDDIARIADRVTQRLLDHVRVETEEDRL